MEILKNLEKEEIPTVQIHESFDAFVGMKKSS